MGSAKLFFVVAAVMSTAAAQDVKSRGLLPPKKVQLGSSPLDELNDVDERLDSWEAPSELQKLAPYYKMGLDDEGSPVYVVEYGRWNYKLLANEPEKVQQIFWKYWEQFCQRILRDGLANENQGVIIIIDWEGFSLGSYASARALQMSLNMFSSFPSLYPALKYGFMINTNFAAANFINIAKPFLGSSLEKFDVFGTQPQQWKPALRRKIPQGQLPPKYGGSYEFRPLGYGAPN